jgi:hypothetical protein
MRETPTIRIKIISRWLRSSHRAAQLPASANFTEQFTVILDDHYKSCKDALMEARRLVLEKHDSARCPTGRKQMRSLQPMDALELLKWPICR